MIDTPTQEERTFSAMLCHPYWRWTWGPTGQRCLLRPRTSDTTHVHEWRLEIDGPDCDECQYWAIIGEAHCSCGEKMGPTEIERRLNLVEDQPDA